MPEMIGLEAVREIRKISGMEKTPVIMLTSKSQKKDILAAVEAGATDYIVKRIKIGILLEKLGKYFGPMVNHSVK